MNGLDTRLLAGWALVISGLVNVVFSVVVIFNLPQPGALMIIVSLATLLLIVGLPAVQLSQPATGWPGWLGIGLMELAAVIAFVVSLLSLLTSLNIPSGVPFTSALAGMIGDILVGLLTIRARVFPAWIGWALAISGVVNFAGGLLPNQPWLPVVVGLFEIAGAVAIAGYGWSIVQSLRGAPTTARQA
jgi:hypothetical protein